MEESPAAAFQFSVTRMLLCMTLVFVSLAMTLAPPRNPSTGLFDREPLWLIAVNLAGPAIFGCGFGLLWRRPILGAVICFVLFWAAVGVLLPS
jgi:hypothetical protein